MVYVQVMKGVLINQPNKFYKSSGGSLLKILGRIFKLGSGVLRRVSP